MLHHVQWALSLGVVLLLAACGGATSSKTSVLPTAVTGLATGQQLVIVEQNATATAPGLEALDPVTGQVRWQVADGQRDANVPSLIIGGTIISLRVDPQHQQPNALVALRVADGGVRWRVTTPGFNWTLQIMGSMVILLTNANKSNLLTAYRLTDGVVAWTTTLPNGLEHQGTAWPTAPGLLLIPSSGDSGSPGAQLLAVRATDGQVAWHEDLGNSTDLPMLIGDTLIAHACQDSDRQNCALSAVRVADGTPLWHSGVLGAILGTTTQGGVLYADIITPAGKTVLQAIDSASGHMLWQSDLPSLTDQPVIQGDLLYHLVMHLNGVNEIMAWQASTGHALWHSTIQGSSYVLVGNTIYVPAVVSNAGLSSQAVLSRYDALSGKEEATVSVKDNVASMVLVSDPPPANGTGYALLDQSFVALDLTQGAIRWHQEAPPGWMLDLQAQVFSASTAFLVARSNDQHPVGQVIAVDSATGTARWTTTLASSALGLMVVTGG